MKISAKKGVFFLIIFLAGAIYLLGIFYFANHDLGNFVSLGKGQGAVAGEKVRRWRLPDSEILVAFAAGEGEFSEDKLFLTASLDNSKRWLRIIRSAEGILLYEQELAGQFVSARWQDDNRSFAVFSAGKAKKIIIAAGQNSYELSGF